MRFVPPALVVVLTARAACAATLLVPGTHATIQAAVDAAQSGDLIKVAKGVYAPFAVVDKTNLTIKGKGKTKSIVDGGSGAAVLVAIRGSERITLHGLVIRNGSARGIDVEDSQSVTIRRCTVTLVDDALRAHGSGNVVVQTNRFEAIEEDAVDFSSDFAGPAHDSQVRKNRFTDIGDDAIEIAGNGHFVEKNRIEGASGNGIVLDDVVSDATIRKNRITDTGGDGMVLTGTGHDVEKNRIATAGDDGLVMDASGSTLRGNTVTNAADNGIEVGTSAVVATYNTFDRNRVTGCMRNGFLVADGGNMFRRNTATQNGVVDLLDTAGAGANVYEKNRFGTEQIP